MLVPKNIYIYIYIYWEGQCELDWCPWVQGNEP